MCGRKMSLTLGAIQKVEKGRNEKGGEDYFDGWSQNCKVATPHCGA